MHSFNLINGNIITLNNSFPVANSLSIEKGKIISINQPISKFKTFDIKGATLIPGFIDAHFHLKNYGKRLQQVDLKGIKSLNKIRKILLKKTSQINDGEWILGFGWDQNLWIDMQFPPKDFLNNIAPNNPVYLTRIDGHSSWVNDAAIKMTGQSLEKLDMTKGGKIINECIMVDNAMNHFRDCLPKESTAQIKKWILSAANNAKKMGITGVHDAWQDRKTVNAIKDLIKENKFPIRCYGMLASNDDDLLSEYFDNGHYNDEYLTIRSVKAFIDGALGSRGAALHEPYADDANNCGLILISNEKFLWLAQKCFDNNFQLNTHAIGDRGNHYVLNHYGSVLNQKNNRRWRIEHAQMVADQDILQFKEYNILPSMQPSHCTSDMSWLPDRIGNDRLKLISRWQTFIDAGLIIPGGSDCPIETGNPLFEFYAAITRQNHKGLPKRGFQSQEKVNSINALKMFTSWAAYGGFDEKKRGKIDIGYDADFTILDNNILSVKSKDILTTNILYTIINGYINDDINNI